LGPGAARSADIVRRAADGLPRIFRGRVVAGRRLGRQLGVPTANLAVDDVDPAVWGSWAALARTVGRVFRAIAHVGIRPSVGGERLVVEAHLFGFDGDLYGRPLTVHLLERVSEERALPSLDALERKIHEDVRLVREFFARSE
jgi:FAD synthase